jgi:hypothetical protein
LLISLAVCPRARADAASLFRRLLVLNFLATRDSAFAVDDARNAVYLRAMRGLVGLGYEEFRDLLQSSVAVATDMRLRLRAR